MTPRTLSVLLHEQVVGHLWGDGTHHLFSFHQSYLDAAERPVLGQYFEDRLHKAARRFRGMHPWFENVLPEPGGALRRRFTRILGLDPSDSLSLLASLGSDLPGAVRVLPQDDTLPESAEVDDEARHDVLASARFSLGGVQLKFAMSGDPERLALGVSDGVGAHWISKLGSAEYPLLAENEHAIMTWCRAAGFDVPETRVIDVRSLPDLGAVPDVPTAYLVRRYDRHEGRRIHQEDFAQVLNVLPGRKYDATDAAGMLDLARQILGEPGTQEGLRRLVVVVATGNADAHLKNWSLLYPDGANAEWSPLYDQVATVAYPQVGRELALRIGHANHLHEVRLDHLRWVGVRAGLHEDRCVALVDETLAALVEAFPAVVDEMPEDLTRALRDHWSTVPLLRPYTLG